MMDSPSSNRMRVEPKFGVFGQSDGGHARITPSDRRPASVFQRSQAWCRRPGQRSPGLPAQQRRTHPEKPRVSTLARCARQHAACDHDRHGARTGRDCARGGVAPFMGGIAASVRDRGPPGARAHAPRRHHRTPGPPARPSPQLRRRGRDRRRPAADHRRGPRAREPLHDGDLHHRDQRRGARTRRPRVEQGSKNRQPPTRRVAPCGAAGHRSRRFLNSPLSLRRRRSGPRCERYDSAATRDGRPPIQSEAEHRGSSAHAKRRRRNENTFMPISTKRLAEIAAIADDDIDTSDIPEADEAWFQDAKQGGQQVAAAYARRSPAPHGRACR